MGVVYRARQLDLDRDVAVKVIAPELVEDPADAARFLRRGARGGRGRAPERRAGPRRSGSPTAAPISSCATSRATTCGRSSRRDGALDPGAGGGDRGAARRRARRHPRRGLRAPRRQAAERHDRRRRPRLPERLRAGQGGARHDGADDVGALGRHARLRRAGADPRAGASTRARTCTRSAASSTSCSPGASRSTARPTRPSCGRTCTTRPRRRRRAAGVPLALDAVVAARDGEGPGEAPAGPPATLGDAARAAAAGPDPPTATTVRAPLAVRAPRSSARLGRRARRRSSPAPRRGCSRAMACRSGPRGATGAAEPDAGPDAPRPPEPPSVGRTVTGSAAGRAPSPSPAAPSGCSASTRSGSPGSTRRRAGGCASSRSSAAARRRSRPTTAWSGSPSSATSGVLGLDAAHRRAAPPHRHAVAAGRASRPGRAGCGSSAAPTPDGPGDAAPLRPRGAVAAAADGVPGGGVRDHRGRRRRVGGARERAAHRARQPRGQARQRGVALGSRGPISPTAAAASGRAWRTTARWRGSTRAMPAMPPSRTSVRTRPAWRCSAVGCTWRATRAPASRSSTPTRLRGGPVEQLRVPLNPYAVAAGDGHVWVTGMAGGTATRIDP